MLQKVTVLLIMAAVVLSITACWGGPKIKTHDQAFDLVIDRLENSSFEGENCLKLVMEQSEEAGYEGRPSRWRTTALLQGHITEHFSIVRNFDRPAPLTEYGMQWRVYPDGVIELQHRYPPC